MSSLVLATTAHTGVADAQTVARKTVNPYPQVGTGDVFYISPNGTGALQPNNRANPSSPNAFRDGVCSTIGPNSRVIFLNGRYDTRNMTSNEIWIGNRNCSRNNPIFIKSETKLGAIIDSRTTRCRQRAGGNGPGTTGGFEFFNSSGFVVQGFTVLGGGDACDGYEQGLDAYNSSNITFRGNKVVGVGGRGIGSNDSSSIRIEDNIIIRAAGAHPSCTSAIDHFHFVRQGDTNDRFGYANYIVNNKVVGTRQAPGCGSNGFFETDGNCMVIDRTAEKNYTLRTLIANNVCVDSDGGGVHLFESGYVDVINNTTFRNNRAHDYAGELHVNCHQTGLVRNVRFIANVAVGRPGKHALWGRGNCANAASIKFRSNVVVEAGIVESNDGVQIQTTQNRSACSAQNLVGVSLAQAGFVRPQAVGSNFNLKSNSVLRDIGCTAALPNGVAKYEHHYGVRGPYVARVLNGRIDVGAHEFFGN